MSSPTQNQVAGHPMAIRAGGRRISQSHPRRPSVSSASPPDGAPSAAAKDNVPPATGDGYPRPETGHTEGNGNENGKEDHKDKDKEQEQARRKKKQGIKSDEAKNLALNNAGSASGRAPRHAMSSNMDARIQQPSRAMAI